MEQFPVSDLIDNEILMHRNAHFGGKFEVMLEYYARDGKGVQPDFTLDRIEELYRMEQKAGNDLSKVLLSETEMDKTDKALEIYKKLQLVYETVSSKSALPTLIADLILSEDEDPEEEMEAVIAEQPKIIPLLHDLLNADELYDALFPGYGYAPIHAAECLGRIGDKDSIAHLFEKIGTSTFSHEEAIFQALRKFGEPAEEFLLKALRIKPLTKDNERAVLALMQFGENERFSRYCLEFLTDPEVLKHAQLASYLVLGCESLQNPDNQKEFLLLLNRPEISGDLREDIRLIAKQWFPDLP